MGRAARPLSLWEPDTILRRGDFRKAFEKWEKSPFSALDSCTLLIKNSDNPRYLVSRLDQSRLEAIFMKVMDMVYGHKSDSQKIVNMVYCTFSVLSHISFIRKKCLEALVNVCVKNNLLPRSLQIELPLGPADTPYCRGGFADVLKGENQGREVAVKVLRISPSCDLRWITRGFYEEVIAWKALDHPNVVPLLGIPKDSSHFRFAMVSEWMVNGNLNQFVKAHWDANRFKLLGDAARGLIYLHDWGIIHGDLKGTNILVDQTRSARLTDFGLITIHLESATTSSDDEGGSFRWMSPELFKPERFGVKDSSRTKSSDCYALGMVVYEVLTEQAPFSQYDKYATIGKVLRGERPKRPQGPEERWFTDDIWDILGRCWKPKPGDRPSIKNVLQHLRLPSWSWTPVKPTKDIYKSPSAPSKPTKGAYELVRELHEKAKLEFLEELEEFERAAHQRDPFSALDTCTRLIRTANSRRSITRALGDGRLEAIYLRVMDMVYGYKGSDSQTIINTVYRTFDTLSSVSFIRKKCLESLVKVCVKNDLLPRSLQIELPLGPADTPHCRGGFGDVLKRMHQGNEVAVKVLRTSPDCDLRKITRRFHREVIAWRTLDHPNVVPLLGIIEDRSQLKFAMVSEWMENGNLNQFVKAHWDANRFKLLGDAARGLIHLHDWGMIHGDLKGDNILVDNTGNAQLTDFGQVTIDLDSTTPSSGEEGGSSRWMSPELFDPKKFGGWSDGRRTVSSDCYALGMTVYEVLTGRVPFSGYHKYAAVAKVLRGERPERPQGAEGKWFTDDVWGILGRCWEPQARYRPCIEDVLHHLEEASTFWMPLPLLVNEDSYKLDLSPWTLSVLSIGGTSGGTISLG